MNVGMERWTRKVALVTGASAGIGKAIAIELCKQGMKVAALARRAHKLQELENEVQKGFIKGIQCDVTRQEEVRAAIEQIKNWGPVSVLINNAAIIKEESLLGRSIEGFSEVMKTNVNGGVICIKEVVANMKKYNVQHGHIININSSTSDHIPVSRNLNCYFISKYALSAISEALLNELALENSSFKVTQIKPRYVQTDMIRCANVPYPRLHPEDVSNCVTYILSTPPNVNVSQICLQAVGTTKNIFDELPKGSLA